MLEGAFRRAAGDFMAKFHGTPTRGSEEGALAVSIGNESSHVTYSGYQTVSEVTNDGSTAVTVKVTQHAYDENMKKIGTKQEQTVTIPANTTVKVKFNMPNYKKPYTSYTDVYDQNGKFLAGTIDDIVLDNYGNPTYAGQFHTDHFYAPFPWRIYEEFGPGWQGQFVVDSVTGAPPGWTVTVLHPELGVPFSLTPMDRENPGSLLIQTPANVPEGTVVFLDILQKVVNTPDEPLYRIKQRIGICVDTTPPTVLLAETNPNMTTRKITLRAQGQDAVTGIGGMRVKFSNDGGVNWAYAPLVPPEDGDDNTAIWEGTIGPFCAGQVVRTVISMSDGVGNSTDLPEQITQF